MATSESHVRGAPFLLTTACIIVIIAGLRFASDLLLPFLVATFLAVISLPLVIWLQKKKVPAMLSVPLAVMLILVGIGMLLVIASSSASRFVDNVPEYQERLNTITEEGISWLEAKGVEIDGVHSKSIETEEGPIKYDQQVTPSLSPFKLGYVMEYLQTAINSVYLVVSNLFLVILAQIFFLFEAASLPSKVDRAFGSSRFDSKRLNRIVSDIQTYFSLKTAVSILTGLLISIWTWACGSDMYLLWGLLAFMLNFIPNIGSIIAAVPPTLLALAEQGVTNSLLVALGFLLVNTIIGNVVEPKMMGRRLGMSTTVVFISLVFWGWVWGPVGMLLSIPLTMFVKILLENTEDLQWLAVLMSSDAD